MNLKGNEGSAFWAALRAEAAARGMTVERLALWWLVQQHCHALTIRLAAQRRITKTGSAADVG